MRAAGLGAGGDLCAGPIDVGHRPQRAVGARSQAAPPTAESARTHSTSVLLVELLGVDRRAGQLAEAGEHFFQFLPGVGAAGRTRGGERSGHMFQYIQSRRICARDRGGAGSRRCGKRPGVSVGAVLRRGCRCRERADKSPANAGLLAARCDESRQTALGTTVDQPVFFPPSSANSAIHALHCAIAEQRILSVDAQCAG